MRSQLLVFFAVLGIAAAATFQKKLTPKPEKFKDVEGCYIEQLDEVIPFGQSRRLTTPCKEYQCGTEYVTHALCNMALRDVRKKKKDLPFPECCPGN